MILFEGLRVQVSQGFLSGWKVKDRFTGAISIPNSMLKEKIGFVWMQVRRTKRSASVDPRMSEEVMFSSFGNAVIDPSSDDGILWFSSSPDELADFFIGQGNAYMKDAGK